MDAHEITTPAALAAALEAERFLLLKHSHRCEISVQAYREMERFLAQHAGLAAGWIDVRAHRPLAQLVTEHTGIDHASPQAFWLVGGEVVWHASHFDITKSALEAAQPPRAPRT
ncbi:MAG: bacillithiol system redox-active protein YtxJ [Planctomycetota bacterium]|nr:bacillithiol system redox-active protein YtxJ [Planctomycetota bacterium]